MFVLGDNLIELSKKYSIVDNIKDIDDTCIELRLDRIIKRIQPVEGINTLKYGEEIPIRCVKREYINEKGLILKPNDCVLACSMQSINIPCGYMGWVQTKGSLARMFVFAHCSDSQIDSGFRGKITFELYNASKFDIIIKAGQKIVNLYIVSASDKNIIPYVGKYCNAMEPTIQLP